MPQFDSDGVAIAYDVEGEGDPILLIHGFASSARVNWHDTGWVKVLTGAGYTVITFDNRGHGKSGKLYDPRAYPAPLMAEDARRLLDHLGIPRAYIMGYSMGARIATFLTLAHPDRVRAVILGGLAANLIRSRRRQPTTLPIRVRGPSASLPIRRKATAARLPPVCGPRGSGSVRRSLPGSMSRYW
jgi:pimeloyl-ACP methyl ester carboxylesterase